MNERISLITDLAWMLLEEAEIRPIVEKNWNPGTVWALFRRGLITDGPFGTILITDAGIETLRARRELFAVADELIAIAPPERESITHLDPKPS